MRCPECNTKLNLQYLICKKGHQFKKEDGIYIFLNASFKAHLDTFLSRFEQVRNLQNRKILDTKVYEQLPYVTDSIPQKYRHIWISRQQSLQLVKPFFQSQKPKKVLNYASWNGWLSNRLKNRGHDVTAISYFVDEWDGLGAMKHYKNEWRSIQMDVQDLSIFDEKFDLIILNHGIEYITDFRKIINDLLLLLAHNGTLVILGLSFFNIPHIKKYRHAKKLKDFKNKYGFDMGIHPSRGFLDFKDKKWMESRGIQVIKNPFKKKEHLKANLLPIYPKYFYGIFHK